MPKFPALFIKLKIKSNFKEGNSDLMCRKCSLNEENQRHLLVCPKLSDNTMISTNPLDYEDFLGAETNKIEIIGRILIQRFNLLTH